MAVPPRRSDPVGSLQSEQEDREWERAAPRKISNEQWHRFERYLAEVFKAMGMPLDTPGTARTPERFLRALLDATEGYEGDPKLVTAFPTECRGGADCRISQVVEGPIQFYSLCEHHARRFSVQERLGQQVIEALDSILQPHGAAVYLDATHLCTEMRGVQEDEATTRTTFWRGAYDSDPTLRSEFLALCGIQPSAR